MRPENIMFSEQRRRSLAKMKDLVLTPKPVIKVTLTDEQKNEFVPQYTSLDEIIGEVSITASCDTSFEELYISFEGSASTFVEKVATTSPTIGRSDAYHNFVRLVQPVDLSAFPNARVLEAGKTYKFPFTFVVPEKLLPQSCKHKMKPGFPTDGHMALPPSLGDPLVASMGKSLMDDMAPHMGSIAYSIRGRITCGRGDDGRIKIMAEGSKKLRIIPAIEEQPPLDVIPEGDDRYDFQMRKEKNIRKGTLKGKLGRIVVQSAQPQSLKLPYSRGPYADCSPTTMATMKVRFDPVEESSPPPGLSSLQAKLKVATCFTTHPMDEIPTKSSEFHFSNVRGIYVDTVTLSTLCLSNLEWQKHTPSTSLPNPQHAGIPNPSETYNGGPFYTALIAVPVSLPKGNKVLVPSFHSCYVSRMYALDLYLAVNTPSATVTDPIVHLKLPLQVSSEGNPHAMPTISAQEQAAIEAREANDYFDPNSVANAAPGYTELALHHDAPNSASSGNMRMARARQRFQSLSFEDEGMALPPPPDYAQIGGASRRDILTNAPSPPSSPRSI